MTQLDCHRASCEPREPIFNISLMLLREAEDAADGVNDGGVATARLFANFGDGAVRHLGHHALGERFESLFLLRRQIAEAAAQPFPFTVPDGFELFLEADDGGRKPEQLM